MFITLRDIKTMEEAGAALIRSGAENEAWGLLALALRFRGESGLNVPFPDEFSKRVPSNVVKLFTGESA